jgi:hypothetical protein
MSLSVRSGSQSKVGGQLLAPLNGSKSTRQFSMDPTTCTLNANALFRSQAAHQNHLPRLRAAESRPNRTSSFPGTSSSCTDSTATARGNARPS